MGTARSATVKWTNLKTFCGRITVDKRVLREGVPFGSQQLDSQQNIHDFLQQQQQRLLGRIFGQNRHASERWIVCRVAFGGGRNRDTISNQLRRLDRRR